MKASEKLAENLQRVLVDLIDLHLQGKQAHWNVAGKNFRDLHMQLDEIIASARTFSDEVAERLRALQSVPDGRTSTVAQLSDLPAYPDGLVDTTKTVSLIVERLDAAVGAVREVHSEVDEEDPASADILNSVILELEKQRWMLSMENE